MNSGAPVNPGPRGDLIGRTLFGVFRVDAFIASGSVGSVYRAWDLQREAAVAVKILHPRLARQAEAVQQFRDEALALQQLEHRNIVPFYGLYQDAECVALVVRFIDGRTLKQVIDSAQGHPLPVSECLVYLRSLCAALGYAHRHGIVHRDVKPGNVLIDQSGWVYLTDFGLAHFASRGEEGAPAAGTPAYMAPEQVEERPLVPASDIYSLGVMLYELISGRRPFLGNEPTTQGQGTTPAKRVRYAHVNVTPPNPRTYNPEISPALAAVTLRALSKHPSKRFGHTAEFLEAVCTAVGVSPDRIPERLGASEAEAPAPGTADTATTKQAAGKIVTAAGTGVGRIIPRRKVPLFIAIAVVVVAVGALTLAGGGGGGGIAPPAASGGTQFTIRPYNSPLDDHTSTCVECDVTGWSELEQPGSKSWNVTFPYGERARLSNAWCASDDATLAANLLYVTIELRLDGQKIPSSRLAPARQETPGQVCKVYSGVRENWSKGPHSYTWVQHISQEVNDGDQTYPAGDYMYTYYVEVR
ncbi:MAG TPA: serine/threonine-protein kinase [Moraxellaceae bacterium]|nr:serine/threonine-protein kinase [Moraxellaceae bacterium]